MPKENKHQTTGHVIYTCTPEIKNIFLHESSNLVFAANKGGIKTPAQAMSTAFKEFLEKNGFEIVEEERKFYQGINYFCGVKIEITKVKEKGDIKQLFITVYGKNDREIVEKLDVIQKNVAVLCKTKPQMETYTKVTRC